MKIISNMIVEHLGKKYEVSYDDKDGSLNGCSVCCCKSVCNMSECSLTIGSNGYFLKEVNSE